VKRAPEAWRAALRALEQSDLRRTVIVPPADALDFSSNDYLGLRRHPALAASMAAAATAYGAGAGASHLVTGHGPEHAALEQELADFTGRERALLFSSGYLANLGVLSSLLGRGDLALQDRLNHASLLDAAVLARSTLQRYAHLNAAEANERLMAHGESTAAIVTDAVFSMDGDIAPLPALAAAAERHGAWLIVDDAHGIGVTGPNGRGTCAHFGLSAAQVPVLVGTLGKALGSFGAFVAGDSDLIDWLIQHARTYIYTTALPQPVAAATRAALRLLDREAWRLGQLHDNVRRFRERAVAAKLPLLESTTPIQPVLLGAAARALKISAELLGRGFIVKAIRPPTVPADSARLRVSLSATHSVAQVDALVDALTEALVDTPAAAESSSR
jgi:8-amino-7-oxononanoate synthase